MLKGEDGSTQITATFFCCAVIKPISESVSVLLPAPGGPVIPMTGIAEGGNDFRNVSYPGDSFSINEIQRDSALILPLLMSFFNCCHMLQNSLDIAYLLHTAPSFICALYQSLRSLSK
jgi:hypothetical protein